jgi:hypothetical protein
MTTAMLVAFGLSGALCAAAETDFYKDIRRPNGHARDMAAKQADFSACGYPGSSEVPARDFPKFNTCMRAHGWVIDHVVPDPSPTVVYNRDSKDPNVGWHWEGGMRACHNDCDNPEIPGSGFSCKTVAFMGSRPENARSKISDWTPPSIVNL